MSLEKAIQKLTEVISAAKTVLPHVPGLSEDTGTGPIGTPPLKATCKTEIVGVYPNSRQVCVCRNPKHQRNCALKVTDGACETTEGYPTFTTSVPFPAPCVDVM